MAFLECALAPPLPIAPTDAFIVSRNSYSRCASVFLRIRDAFVASGIISPASVHVSYVRVRHASIVCSWQLLHSFTRSYTKIYVFGMASLSLVTLACVIVLGRVKDASVVSRISCIR